jgi:uncharacterized protein YlxW (UPF0749 family)
MGLFVDLWSNGLEPAYRTEAARRAATGPAPRRRGSLLAAAGLAAAGVVLATAAAQAQREAPVAARARQSLAEQVERRTATTDRLAAEVAAQQAALAGERDAALDRDRAGQALADRVRDLEALVGATAVTGPGLRVVLDDADPAEDTLAGDASRSAEAPPGRLLDRDLQDVVNALWAAGAEAVAVNGQRLSALSAISNAGDAVLVDLRPVTPPYVVEAVGDPARLEPAFVDSPAGRRFATYVSLLGITFEVDRAEDLLLPPASVRVGTGAGEDVPAVGGSTPDSPLVEAPA